MEQRLLVFVQGMEYKIKGSLREELSAPRVCLLTITWECAWNAKIKQTALLSGLKQLAPVYQMPEETNAVWDVVCTSRQNRVAVSE